MRTTCFGVTFFLFLLGACFSQNTSPDPDLDRRIRRVEDGFWGYGLCDRMAQNHVPGLSIAVIRNSQTEWAKGYGLTKSGSNGSVTTETLFQASSISKAITAVVALNLVQAGQLDLDRDVNDSLVSWQVPDNSFTSQARVTLRQLLNHTAGVNRPEGGFGHDGVYPTTAQVLNGEAPATNQPAIVECVPGTELRYSNMGYVIVQQLIEDATGRSFAEIAKETVLEPAGMSSSTFEQPLPKALGSRSAFPHNLKGEPLQIFHHPNAVAQGGLWTTPSDLARFALEIMRADVGENSRILSRKMAEEMLTAHYRKLKGGRFWGLGVLVLGNWGVFQAGADPGFRCLLATFPGQRKGIVVMLNGEGGELLQLRVFLHFVAEYLLLPIKGSLIAAGLSSLVLLSTLIVWPSGYLWNRFWRKKSGESHKGKRDRLARLLAALTAVLILGTIYPFILYVFDPWAYLTWTSGTPAFRMLCGLSFIGAVLSGCLIFITIRVWMRWRWPVTSRIYFSMVALAASTGSLLWFRVLGWI